MPKPSTNPMSVRSEGGFTSYTVFRTPGNFEFTVPHGVRKIMVEAWGGGGGGGGSADGAGGGGAGGSYAADIFSVPSKKCYQLTVGCGGAGGSCDGGHGAAGGTSNFGDLVSASGGGGGGGATNCSTGRGGPSMGAAPPTLNIAAEHGEDGSIDSVARRGGRGGSSPKGGFGGMPMPISGGGGASSYGSAPGGGGSGSASFPGYGGGGSNGMDGRVIVWW